MKVSNKRSSVLLVSDTKDWGGWKRAKMMKKHLKDEFDFGLMDAEEYKNYERKTTQGIFNVKDINQYINSKSHGNDKEFLGLDHFTRWLGDNKIRQKYDLIYFLFHTMLIKKSVKRTLNRGQKVITMVTVYPVIRPGFVKDGSSVGRGNFPEAKLRFLQFANKCTAVLANNKKSLKDLNRFYNGDTFYAPRGVDASVFRPQSIDFVKKPEDQFTVAFCGKPNPEKGLKKIIKPACQVADIKLITNERNFTDALPEGQMVDFYNKADVYIVASTMDGTPNTALEAAACGLPILSNEIGNMPEFINHGKNGFLVSMEDGNDISKYVNRLRWMKQNQRKTWEMGQEARKTIQSKWTWKTVLNKHEREIFRKVINGM